MRVKIMRGISGAGKSWVAAALWPKALVLSGEAECGGAESRSDLAALRHGDCLRRFVAAVLSEGGTVGSILVIDNTNLEAWEIAPYWALAVAYGCGVEIVEVRCRPHVAAARCLHRLSPQEIERQAARLESPLPPHWFVRPCWPSGSASEFRADWLAEGGTL